MYIGYWWERQKERNQYGMRVDNIKTDPGEIGWRN
jgi:hypothetical protein